MLEKIEHLIAEWQEALGNQVQVLLGGSLVSGLFVTEGAEVIDVDVRFLVDDPQDEQIRQQIEAVTGLVYRKTIPVADWPSGESLGVMVEGKLTHPELPLPLDVEGCIRNKAYIGWAKFYRLVLTETELADLLRRKAELRSDKKAYKAFKSEIRDEVERRAIAAGLVSR
jgi:hypothetical protein